MEYIIIGLIVLAAGLFLFRYFRKIAQVGSCQDCAKHCCQSNKNQFKK